MKFLPITILALAASVLGSSLQAQVLIINNLAFNFASTNSTVQSGAGTLGTLARNDAGFIPDAVTATPLNYGVTWSGLTLDGSGSANDSISFVYTITTSQDNFATTSTTRSSSQGYGVGGLILNQTTNRFRLTLSGVTVSDQTGGSVVFDGFSQMNVRANTASTDMSFSANGASASFVNAAVGDVVNMDFAFNPIATLAVTGFTDGTARFFSSDLQFTYTAIPEPTSALLLMGGIGALALLRRRK